MELAHLISAKVNNDSSVEEEQADKNSKGRSRESFTGMSCQSTIELAHLIALGGRQSTADITREISKSVDRQSSVQLARKSSSGATAELNTIDLAHHVAMRRQQESEGEATATEELESALNTMDLALLVSQRAAGVKATKPKQTVTIADAPVLPQRNRAAPVIANPRPEGRRTEEGSRYGDVDASALNTMDLAHLVSQPQRASMATGPKPRPSTAAPIAPVASKRPSAAVQPSRSTSSNQQTRSSLDTMELAHQLVRPSVAPVDDDGVTTMDLANMISRRNGPSIAEILTQAAPTPEILRRPQTSRYV